MVGINSVWLIDRWGELCKISSTGVKCRKTSFYCLKAYECEFSVTSICRSVVINTLDLREIVVVTHALGGGRGPVVRHWLSDPKVVGSIPAEDRNSCEAIFPPAHTRSFG